MCQIVKLILYCVIPGIPSFNLLSPVHFFPDVVVVSFPFSVLVFAPFFLVNDDMMILRILVKSASQ